MLKAMKLCSFLILGGVDFSDFAQSFSLTPLEARRCFNISITDDSVLEVTEYFIASLVQNGELPPGTSLNITSANVQIADNESECDRLQPRYTTMCSNTHCSIHTPLIYKL